MLTYLKKLLGGKQRPMDAAYADRLRNEQENFSKFLSGRESEETVVRAVPSVGAFDFAMELYRPWILARMPNIGVDQYMAAAGLREGRPAKVLSLGCGTGDWEFQAARNHAGALAFELVDVNPHLMESAGRLAVKENLAITTRVEDVNRLRLQKHSFDFVLCRSSLHHFLELEHLFAEVRRGLRPGGALVVIGEWVGRNGLQLHPENEKAAQTIFDTLPERLRRDTYSGEIASRIPNIDHSVNTFEAVRSEDIMPLLLANFRPVEYVVFDTLVSVLLDFRYGRNYNTEDPGDRAIIESIVREDIDALDSGRLRPTAMFGIYAC